VARVRGYDTGGDDSDVERDAADEASLRLEPEDVLEDDGTADVGDEGYVPQDRPWAVDDPAVSGEEESLDQRLAEEEPDVSPADIDAADEDPRAGRLVAPDRGVPPDEEKDEIAEDVGPAGYASSAEEAAVHIVEEPDQRS
jgi:hypothetical protein